MNTVHQDNVARLSPGELDILRKLDEVGAALEPELPIKLNRVGEDLDPEIDSLRKKRLLQVRTVEHDGEKMNIYLTARGIGKYLRK